MNRNKAKRMMIAVLGTAVIIGLVYIAVDGIFPDLIKTLKNGDVDSLQIYLRDQSTFEEILCTVLIQMLLVLMVFITAVPLQVAAGIVFGPFVGFAACTAGTLAGLAASYLLWKFLGERFNQALPVGEKQERMLETFEQMKVKPQFAVFLASIVLFMPKGLLPVLGLKLNVRFGNFISAVVPGISVNVFVCCVTGDRLISGDWLTVALVFSVSALLIILFWWKRTEIVSIMEHVTESHG